MKTSTALFCTAWCLVLGRTLAPAYPVSPTDPANRITNIIMVAPGWSLIANPYYHSRGTTLLDAVADNSLGEVIKSAPRGTVLFKFNNLTQRFTESRFLGRAWSNPSEPLLPGEGAFIFNPSHKPFAVTFTGNCAYGGSVSVPSGWSIISSPDCGTLNFAPLVSGTVPGNGWDNLAFKPQEGDIVYTMDQATAQLGSHTFREGEWDSAPSVGPAEACIVFTTRPRIIRFTGPRPE